MYDQAENRTSPNFTIGEVGLFPPFFGRRIDYLGWLIGRRYHLWLAIGNSMIMIAFGLKVFFQEKNTMGLGIGVLFILTYFIYNRLRRHIFLANKKLYFRYGFQYARALIGIIGVAFLQIIFNKISGGTSIPIWILYVSILLIAGEYQHYSLRGYLGTISLYSLSGLLQFVSSTIPYGATDFFSLALEVIPQILIVWCISFGFLYFIQNIQKRSILLKEDTEYTRQLLQTRRQVSNLDNFLKVCLRICIHRLRASHGSIWVCHPFSGLLEFKTGILTADGKEEIITANDLNETKYFLDKPSNDIVCLAATRKKAVWCAVYDKNPLKEQSSGEPIKFNHDHCSELAYQIAVPVLDKGESGNVIGVINVNFKPGYIDNLSRKWPSIFGQFQKIAHQYILEWQKDLLQFTALQLSDIWEYSRLVYMFDILFGRLPSLYGDLRNRKVANLLAKTLTEAIGTNALVWCYRDTRKEFVLNGIGKVSNENIIENESRNYLSTWVMKISVFEKPTIVPCPDGLLKYSNFPNPSTLILPLKAKQGTVGVVGLLVRNSFEKESLHQEELSIIQAYVDQIAFAVGNERLRKITAEQTHTLEIVQEITVASLKSKSLDSYSDVVRKLMKEKLGYQQVHVGIVRDASILFFPTIDHVKHNPVELGGIHQPATTEIEKVWRNSQKSVYINEVKDGELPLGKNWPNVKSAIVTPLVGGDGAARGVLIVHDTNRGNAYTDTDIHNITSLASVLGLCLDQIVQNMNLQVIAGIKDVKKIITLSLFSPDTEFPDALKNLITNLHSNILTEFDYLQIWRFNRETQQFMLEASSLDGKPSEAIAIKKSDAVFFTDALDGGVYCIDNLIKRNLEDNIKSGIRKGTKAICIAPLRVGSSNIGIMTFGAYKEKDFHKDVSFALEDIARNIGEAWYLRENLEDFTRKTERLQVLNQTHDIALASSQYAMRGWSMTKALMESRGVLQNDTELSTMFFQLGSELKAVQTSMEIAVRGGRFAKIHESGLAGAIEDSINAKKLLFEGEKSITTEFDKSVLDKITRGEAEELFFIFESAMSNALKNKSTTKISVSIKINLEGELTLCIYDNGSGFDFDLARKDTSHFGLRSMELSAQKIGWGLEAKTLGNGTLICVIKSALLSPKKGPAP